MIKRELHLHLEIIHRLIDLLNNLYMYENCFRSDLNALNNKTSFELEAFGLHETEIDELGLLLLMIIEKDPIQSQTNHLFSLSKPQ